MTQNNTQTEISVSALKRNHLCTKSMHFDFEAKDNSSSEAGSRSQIVKDTIINALKYDLKRLMKVCYPNGKQNYKDSEKAYSRAVMEYMATRYDECGFINYQQKQEQLLWDHRRVMRYLNWERRIPSFPEPDTVELGNRTVQVKPDLLFESAPGVAEVVFLKNSFAQPRPRHKNGADEFYEYDLQLYSAILYARKKGYNNITASIYFMKKRSDCSNWYCCSQEFTGDNIIRMIDLYDGKDNELDDKIRSQYFSCLNQGIDDEEMKGIDCRFCPHYDICKYELPSISTYQEMGDSIIPSAVSYTDQQQKVIDFNHGVARVIAAAGSGKTQTIAGRIVRLLQDGVKPEEILCITFSNSGAQEMKRKIARQCLACHVKTDLEKLAVTTFHAFEFDIVKSNWKKLGYKKELTVIDTVQKYSVINRILKKHPVYEWGGKSFLNYTVSSNYGMKGALAIVADIFSEIKAMDGDENTDPRLLSSVKDLPSNVAKEIVSRYLYYKEELLANGLVDFEDMELNAFSIIDNDPDYLNQHCAYRHIFIDEYQDTSGFQMELVKRLRQNSSFESLMIVGDDWQSIYGFRGTSPEYILNFERHFNSSFMYRTINHSVSYTHNSDHVEDLYLTQNWRSKQEILDLSSQLLEYNSSGIKKTIDAARGNGGIVTVQGYDDIEQEYRAIAEMIKAEHDQGIAYDNMAVLAFTKNELRKLASCLTNTGIPSMFGAPEPISENSRIRALLAFVKLLENTENTKNAAIVANAVYRASDLSLTTGIMELPRTEILERVGEVVYMACQINQERNPKEKKEMLLSYIRSFSLEDETVEHFLEATANLDYDETISYCQDFERFGLAEEYRRLGEYPGVKLITAHSSKGLEWGVVFFTPDGIAKSFNRKASINDELRRLEFVAMTRARDTLHVTGLRMRKTASGYALNVPLQELLSVYDQKQEKTE